MRALLTVAVLALGLNAFATETKTAPAAAPAAQPAAVTAPAAQPAVAAATTGEKDCNTLKGAEKKACLAAQKKPVEHKAESHK
jgi:hypothetical protein